MSEILCSRCGTPFPQEKGKPAVTCAVCGQLRPDLDVTLDDDDDISGAFGGVAPRMPASMGTPAAPASQPRSHVIASVTSLTGAAAPPPPPTTRNPYVPMSDEVLAPPPRRGGKTLTEELGPVVLIVTPLAAGVVGALKMLSLVDDFSAGSWYAVGSIFFVMLAAASFAGVIASGILFAVRARWSIVLRVAFVLAAVATTYVCLREIPKRVQVRENALPGIMLVR